MKQNNDHTMVCKAILDSNNKIVEYRMAIGVDFFNDRNLSFDDYPNWKFIGEGLIYSVGGMIQKSTEKNYFFI